MAGLAHILGDLNDGGGEFVGPAQTFVRIQGKPVAIDGCAVSGHALHPPTATANGAAWARIGGIPINRVGDADACGHVRAATPSHVFIGD